MEQFGAVGLECERLFEAFGRPLVLAEHEVVLPDEFQRLRIFLGQREQQGKGLVVFGALVQLVRTVPLRWACRQNGHSSH